MHWQVLEGLVRRRDIGRRLKPVQNEPLQLHGKSRQAVLFLLVGF